MPSNAETQPNNDLFGEESEDDDEIDDDDDDSPSDVPQTPLPITVAAPAPQPQNPPSEDSRKLFQRLWTDEDEIGLLRGFLDYSTQRGGSNNSSYHIDTWLFYDQIKSQLHLDFNKNQLVDKLRRLKKKYRNAVDRITSGKDFSFKTPHDQTTFEISHKIWSGTGTASIPEDDEIKNESNKSVSATVNKVARKRPRLDSEEEKTVSPSVIEDTIKSCVSPFLKELISCATTGYCNLGGGVGLTSFSLNFEEDSSMSMANGEIVDDKWRNQQISELEVYSKRVELVKDQIKSALEELKATGN